MTKHSIPAVLFSIVVLVCAGASHADELSVYQIQSTTSDGDASIYDGQIHNVDGGVVTHMWSGFTDRVYLQVPGASSWGGICVKDWEGELLAALQIGDWVSFDNILIQEHRGTTFLQYDKTNAPSVTFTIESSGNTLPDPIALMAADLVVPVDHARTEPYESMLVTLENVIVGQMGLGKASDNYELRQTGDVAWGTDYMNVDAGGPYDPRIVSGRVLLSITGIVEQYTKASSGWDYYQLNTRSAGDIVAGGVIPTVSVWGMVVMSLLVVCAATVMLRRVRECEA